MAVPFRALNAMGYFTASISNVDSAMHGFSPSPPLKPAADFKDKF